MHTTDKARASGQKPARRRIAGERRTLDRDTPPSPAQARATESAPARKPARHEPAKRPRAERDPERGHTEQKHPDRPGPLMLTVAGLLAVAVAVVGTLLVRDQVRAAEAAERAQALEGALTAAPARAEKAAKALLSYSHDSIDGDIARATPFLTDKYAEDYTTTMRDVVADPAKQTNATVKAKVLSSGIVDAGTERTDVLVFVNQVTESTNSDKPRTALNRAILTMVKRDGQWVVSDLKGL